MANYTTVDCLSFFDSDIRMGYEAQTYLPLWQWGAVFLLVLSSWKVNIAENPIAVMGLYIRLGKECVNTVATFSEPLHSVNTLLIEFNLNSKDYVPFYLFTDEL